MGRVSKNKQEDNQVEIAEIREHQFQQRKRSRELLKTYEPVVFDVLNQALAQNRLSHAYLFTGPQNALKSHTAMLFTQSLFLHAKQLIEEEKLEDNQKQIALRIAEKNHGDLLVLDGYQKEAISLEKIQGLQELFSKTSLEEGQRKVYIIEHAESMSLGAMNGLLKFLEEPAREVYAILTTDNLERILPTIQSRCVQISFHTLDPKVYEQVALEEGLDLEDAYFLSSLVYRLDGLRDMAGSDAWQTAKTMFQQTIRAKGDERLLFVDYDTRYRSSDKDTNLDMLQYFFGIIIQFDKDVILHKKSDISWYHESIQRFESCNPNQIAQHMKIAVEAKDRCNRNNDLTLVLAQAIYQWEEIK